MHFKEKTMVTRQQRRASERSAIRKVMTKKERRATSHLKRPIQREIYFAILAMLSSGQMKSR
jgi:hypothetical protein